MFQRNGLKLTYVNVKIQKFPRVKLPKPPLQGEGIGGHGEGRGRRSKGGKVRKEGGGKSRLLTFSLVTPLFDSF